MLIFVRILMYLYSASRIVNTVVLAASDGGSAPNVSMLFTYP